MLQIDWRWIAYTCWSWSYLLLLVGGGIVVVDFREQTLSLATMRDAGYFGLASLFLSVLGWQADRSHDKGKARISRRAQMKRTS